MRSSILSFLASLVADNGIAHITLTSLAEAPLLLRARIQVDGANAEDLRLRITARHFLDCFRAQWPVDHFCHCDLGQIKLDGADAILLEIRFASIRALDS